MQDPIEVRFANKRHLNCKRDQMWDSQKYCMWNYLFFVYHTQIYRQSPVKKPANKPQSI